MPRRLPLLRSGECNRCGSCCVGDPFDGAEGEPAVPGYCPHFRWESPGVGACAGRDSAYYLRGCVDWPAAPEHVAAHPSCSYRFG